MFSGSRLGARNLQESWDTIKAKNVSSQFPNLMRRIETREEVTDLAIFLASKRVGYLNGQNIRIDGGTVDVVQA